MNDAVSALVALVLLSLMLAIVLATAWAMLGRPRHALTWAAAFTAGTVQWAIYLASAEVDERVWPLVAIDALSLIVSALLTLGFRQRAALPGHHALLALACGVATAVMAAATVADVGWLARATPLLFRAVLVAGAAAIVVRRGARPNGAERSMIVMLWLLALFCIAVAAVTIAAGTISDAWAGVDRWLLILGLPTLFTGTGLFIVFLLAADLAERMRELAARDPLTGVLNRRGFEEAAGRAVANALRHAQPLSLAIADLDRFKLVNDMHGHAVGDALLRRFGDGVSEAIRQGDLFGRLGGEEFVLLLVNTPGDAAAAVVDRLRREVATLTLDTDPPLTVTTSFGVAELLPGDRTLAHLLERADRALYRSKLGGRDRVTVAAPEPVG